MTKKVKRTLALVISLVVLLLTGVMFFGAPLVSYVANQSLKQQKLTVNIDKLYLNPFTLRAQVTQLSVSHIERPLLSLETLAVDLDAWQLINGAVDIESLALSGVNLESEWQQNILSFAHWQPQLQSQSQSQAMPSSAPQEKSSLPLRAHNIKVNKLSVNLLAQQQHQWHIKQLILSDLSIVGASLQAKVSLVSEVNQQPFDIELAINHHAEQSKVTVKQAKIGVQLTDFAQWLPSEFALNGQLLVVLSGELVKQQNVLQANNVSTDIQLTNFSAKLAVQEQPTQLTINHIKLNAATSDQLAFNLAADSKPLTGQVNWQLATKQIDWHMLDSGDVLAKLAEISATEGKVLWQDEPELAIGQLSIGSGIVSQPSALPTITFSEPAKPIEPLVTLNNIALNQLTVTPASVTIDEVKLNLAQAVIYKSKQFGAENWLLADKTQGDTLTSEASETTELAATSEAKLADSPQAPAFAIDIGKVSISDNKSSDSASHGNTNQTGANNSLATEIIVYDYTPNEPVTQRIALTEFSLEHLNSLAPTQPSLLNIHGQLSKRASVNVSGNIYPFTPYQDLQLKGSLSAVNLAPYSPYVVDAINHRISQGQLSADFDIALKAQQINGQVSTEIKAMSLVESEHVKAGKSGGTVIPLSVAINQLSDQQGNIKLDFPLSGDMNAPSLGLSGLISIITTKALKEGAKNYMIQTFLPYANIISVGYARQ